MSYEYFLFFLFSVCTSSAHPSVMDTDDTTNYTTFNETLQAKSLECSMMPRTSTKTTAILSLFPSRVSCVDSPAEVVPGYNDTERSQCVCKVLFCNQRKSMLGQTCFVLCFSAISSHYPISGFGLKKN